MPIRPSWKQSTKVYATARKRNGSLRTFVKNFNGYSVALSNGLYPTHNVLYGHFHIVKIERARARSTNAELLFLLSDLDAHVLLNDEACDAFVAFRGIDVGKYEEY